MHVLRADQQLSCGIKYKIGGAAMQRYGSIIGVKKEKLDDYKYHHAHIWPEINAMIKECNISNYSIYNFGELLFSYYVYRRRL